MSEIRSVQGPAGFRQTLASWFLALGMTAVIGGALLFQHVGGYLPCALCLEQRTPYYIGVPLAFLAAIAALLRARPVVIRGLLLAVGLLMLWSLGLAIYHAGVEWQFWPGPADCAAPAGADLSGDLLSSLDAVHPPSCTTAALRIFGLSLAGWNAIASLVFAVVALRSAFARADRFA